MKSIIALAFVCMFIFMLSVNGLEMELDPIYERSGSCNFTQECVYHYRTMQSSFGEEEREKIFFSTDVHWHCESSGSFGTQPANEYCFTLSDANLISSVDFDMNDTVNYTASGKPNDTIGEFLEDQLKGEFCYVQTRDGKIASIHFSQSENQQSLNIKKGIAAVFQANFDNAEKIIESDPGSSHISHYKYLKTSGKVVSFTRTIKAEDLIDSSGDVPDNSLDYTKHEKSTFINKILYRSSGLLTVRVDYGQDKDSTSEPPASDTFNPNFHFDKEIEVNGTYELKRKYCKQRQRRSFIFTDLTSNNIYKGTLKAVMDMDNLDKQRIRKIRENIPSIAGFFEELRRNPNNTQLVDILQQLLALEAKFGPPPKYTAVIEQIVDYYKKIKLSNKPEDIPIRILLYSFFSTDGSGISQKILASSLLQDLEDEEKIVLLHQLMQLRNVNIHLVNTIIDSNPNNDDSIILVLGALAKNSNVTIQKIVVNELLKRLNIVITSTNNTEAIIALTYALGNSGSKLAIHALLSSLQNDDIDIQIAAIRSLGHHLDQPIVQEAIMILLALTDEDKILEEILMILIDAYDSMIVTNPSNELLNAIISCTVKFNNPNLYALFEKYLQKINSNVEDYMNLLKQQHNYGEVSRDLVNDTNGVDSRVKRGSDWDEYNSDYDVVASYSQRRSDVLPYPYHKAYIWGKTYGVDKLNVKVGAGGFVGVGGFNGAGGHGVRIFYHLINANKRTKVFAKAAAKLQVFWRSFSLVNLEYSDRTSGDNALYKNVFVKLGSNVIKNIYKSYTINSCKNNNENLWNSGEYTVFNLKFNIWVFVGTIGVYLRGSVSSRGDLNLCICPAKESACGNVVPTLTARVSGGASASLLFLVRGGIEVSATITYFVKPELCIEASFFSVSYCVSVYHGLTNSYIDIYPWHQTRTIRRWRIRWGDVHRWDKLSRRWSISGSSRGSLLWSYCPTPIKSPC